MPISGSGSRGSAGRAQRRPGPAGSGRTGAETPSLSEITPNRDFVLPGPLVDQEPPTRRLALHERMSRELSVAGRSHLSQDIADPSGVPPPRPAVRFQRRPRQNSHFYRTIRGSTSTPPSSPARRRAGVNDIRVQSESPEGLTAFRVK